MDKDVFSTALHWGALLFVTLFGPADLKFFFLIISILFEALTVILKHVNDPCVKFERRKFWGGYLTKFIAYLLILSVAQIADTVMHDEFGLKPNVRNTVCILLIAFDLFNILSNIGQLGFTKEVGMVKALLAGMKNVFGKAIETAGKEEGKDDERKTGPDDKG